MLAMVLFALFAVFFVGGLLYGLWISTFPLMFKLILTGVIFLVTAVASIDV